jgi:hypothetical protein
MGEKNCMVPKILGWLLDLKNLSTHGLSYRIPRGYQCDECACSKDESNDTRGSIHKIMEDRATSYSRM